MEKYSWVSPYREKKFLEAHERKVELLGDGILKDSREKVVVIMLDVQGTIDNINDEKAETFMSQLHRLRIKYGASKVIINVSSHIFTANGLIKYLEILHRNLKPNIILDDAAYLYGTYNYETGVDEVKSHNYNLKKTETFENKYFNKYRVLCHGIMDDSVSFDYIKRFKDIRPVFVLRPSQSNSGDLSRDNMMCHSTMTNGFDGLLECMDTYLSAIENIPFYDIVRRQSEELIHLSAWEVKHLCISKRFDLVLRYVSEGKLDDDDYELVAREIGWLLKDNKLDGSELGRIRKIIETLGNYLDKDNECLLSLNNYKKGNN